MLEMRTYITTLIIEAERRRRNQRLTPQRLSLLRPNRRRRPGSLIGYASGAVDFGFRTWRPRYMPLLRSM
jgi:hypothetical protein